MHFFERLMIAFSIVSPPQKHDGDPVLVCYLNLIHRDPFSYFVLSHDVGGCGIQVSYKRLLN